MTTSQIFAHLNAINAEVALCRNTYRYSDDNERWACSITLENDRSELKFRANAADAELALSAAYEKLAKVIEAPAVIAVFSVPALPAPVDLAPQLSDV
jgi:hypothetical protein